MLKRGRRGGERENKEGRNAKKKEEKQRGVLEPFFHWLSPQYCGCCE